MSKRFWSLLLSVAIGLMAFPQLPPKVDYSVVSVSEEAGTDFTKITSAGDYVALPQVKRGASGLSWLTNRIIDISPDGNTLAFVSARNNTTNIFLTDINRQSGTVQRTKRAAVLDFSFSPDGKNIVFSEIQGNDILIFATDAKDGYICRQITSANKDVSPVYSKRNDRIFFCRMEYRGTSVWGYNLKNHSLSSYFAGMNPHPIPDDDVMIIAKTNAQGRSEIWRVNTATGVEECIISSLEHSFTSPTLSPDGKWLLFVGDGQRIMPNGRRFFNTDLFAARSDGSALTQLTYHAADDLSPVWSRDGRYIYFVSQRGDTDGTANIWRMSFNLDHNP